MSLTPILWQGFPEILKGDRIDACITRYQPPFDEFEVDHLILSNETSTVFPAVSGPSIFVVTAGEGKMSLMGSSIEDPVHDGDVFFAPANTEIGFTSTSGKFQVYRAGINGRFLQLELQGSS